MDTQLYNCIDYKDWENLFTFGDCPNPDFLSPVSATYSLLESKGIGEVYAAVDGKLSPAVPGSGINPDHKISYSSISPEHPSTIDLYLHIENIKIPSPFGEIAIIGLAYLNLFTRDVIRSLSGIAESRDYINRMLVGEMAITINAGQHIGHASRDKSGNRRLGLAAISESGPVDLTFFLNGCPIKKKPDDLGKLISLLGTHQPTCNTDINEAVKESRYKIFSMPELELMKHKLSHDQWTEVGYYQKKIWLHLLRSRSGFSSPLKGSSDFTGKQIDGWRDQFDLFNFNILDWKNIFQLEALTEFFINYNDPWLANTRPVLPDSDKYKKINFLDPRGTGVEILESSSTGRFIELGGFADLSDIKPGNDTISINEKRYTIKSIKSNERRVELNAAPDISDTYSWRIHLSPIIVIIDPFGPRFKGSQATLEKTGAGNIVRLEDCSEMNFKKINRFFDTVFFSSDQGRIDRTYRIIERNVEEKTITLDAVNPKTGIDSLPVFDEKYSDWQIQAGICHNMPPLHYDLHPGYYSPKGHEIYPHEEGYYGHDHFDAMLFVIKGDKIHGMYRWSSYTSRINRKKYDGVIEYLSSIRGNKEYQFYSTTDGYKKCHHNYCFAVIDKKNIPGKAFNDNVKEARFYFSQNVRNDSVPTGLNNSGRLGKTAIRIHWSVSHKNQKQCGKSHNFKSSAGCLVSPLFEPFRKKIINLYQDDYSAINHKKQTFPEAADSLDHYESERAFQKAVDQGKKSNIKKQWNNKIWGRLWLIRPDERPL